MNFVVQLAEPAAQFLPHLRVERAERFIEQQHAGFDSQRPCQSDALALAAGKLRGIAPSLILQLDQPQQLFHLGADLLLAGPQTPRADAQPERDVLEHGHVPEQRVMLKHEPHVPFAGRLIRDVLAVELHGSAIREFQSGNDAEQRRLSRTGGPQQCDELAIRDFQIHFLQRFEVPEILRNAAHADAHEFDSVSLAD